MKKKKAFAFDFDGTLASSFSLEDEVMQKACESVGYDVSKEEIHVHYGPTEKGIIREIVGEDNFPSAWNTALALYREGSKKLAPYPGIKELLQELKSQPVMVFLLTGRSQETLDISLTDFGMKDLFQACYTGSDTGENKPQSMERLSRDYDLLNEDIVYIGDTPADIRMMNHARIDIISVGYSHTKEEQEALEKLNPGNTLNTVVELKARLLSLIR